jgi:CRP-like cAMP-binding protein
MSTVDLRENRILAALPDADVEAIRAVSELVPLTLRLPLEVPGAPIEHVFFPLSGLASVVLVRGAQRVEVGIIGSEGATGLSLLLGATTTPLDCFVQAVGRALCLPSAEFLRLADERPALRAQMLLFVLEFHLQLAETALANARGRIEERLARWLLMTHDRLGETTLHLTHEFLSQMLGVRRPGVTTALQSLEEQRVIRSNRAKILVLDRVGLMERANGLYGGPPPAKLISAG